MKYSCSMMPTPRSLVMKYARSSFKCVGRTWQCSNINDLDAGV